MRKYSAAAIGLLVVGLLSACGDPNETISVECSVFFDKDGNLVPASTGFSAIPKPRQIKVLRKDSGNICQRVRELSDTKQLRFCSATNLPPCIEPDAQQVAQAQAKPNPVEPEPFTEPPVVEGIITSNLIEPTDRKERLNELKANDGRKDPFQELDAQVPPLPPPPKAGQPASPPPRPATPSRGTITIKEPIVAEVPPPPDPAEAKAVKVSGILQIGQEVVAIASVPGDRLPTRTIRPGQKIADGKVLVKSIDTSGLTPAVVLEQFGIEVRRGVGEVVAAAEPEGESLPPQPNP
ncbi:MAG: hypothetical protein LDL47_00420 [Cyanobacteria bacterium KgW148]|nr:hypothetical protein [Cyanobacteria bacterium KgW148]